MFNENDEFDDISNEPPSFVAGQVQPSTAPQRKIGISAGVDGSRPHPGEAKGDAGKVPNVSNLAGGMRALNLRPGGDNGHPGQNLPLGPQDDVFDFDPGFQEDPNQEFTESDVDDDEDDDASSANDNSYAEEEGDGRGSSSSRQAQNVAVFSTSVPINVPQFNNYHRLRHQRDQDSPDDVRRGGEGQSAAIPTNGRSRRMKPDDMAASIQALARSVHGDTSEMVFGELPRSRTHIQRTLSNQPSAVAPNRASDILIPDHDNNPDK